MLRQVFTKSLRYTLTRKPIRNYTGRLRTVSENAAVYIVSLDNAIASENEFSQAIFGNPNVADNQYALALQSIKSEYNNIEMSYYDFNK